MAIYLAVVNVVTFLVYGIDKLKARRSHWRVPESTLLILAAIGGSVGALLGMLVFRHKTRHRKFTIGVPLILIAQVALLVVLGCTPAKKTAESSDKQRVSHPRDSRNIRWGREEQNGNQYVPEHSPTTLLVSYDTVVGKEPLMAAIKEYGASVKYDYSLIPCLAIDKPADRTLEETREYFKKVRGVTHVEYDHIIRLTDPVKPVTLER